MKPAMKSEIAKLRAAIRGRGNVLAPDEADEPILSGPVRLAVFGWLKELSLRAELQGVGIKPRSSALLSGPPGCGKTTLAHHLAARLGVPMVNVGAEHLISSSMGDSEQAVARLFKAIADYDGPCVLFLDEIDAIGAKRRDTGGDRGGAVGAMNSVLTVILRQVEAFEGVLIAATNRAEQLDPALWRRFGMQIEIGMPDEDSRFAILKRYGQPFDFAEGVLDVLTDLTESAAPSLLRQLMEGVKCAIVLGDRLRQPATSLEHALAGVVAQTRPHPDYAPPALWSETRRALAEIARAAEGKPWPPARKEKPNAPEPEQEEEAA